MSTRTIAGVIAFILGLGGAAFGQPPDHTRYQLPPKAIVDILDAKQFPLVYVSPSQQQIALLDLTGMPTIADLSRPMARLAGVRIDTATGQPQRVRPAVAGITLKPIAGGKTVKVATPVGAKLSWLGFSPDGRHLAFVEARPAGAALWVADTTSGAARPLAQAPLNGAAGDACGWVNDRTLLCRLVPANRTKAPREQLVPDGPNVRESTGKPAPVSTYEDLIRNAHDEALFAYYFTSQLALINVATGARTLVGTPGLYAKAAASPDGKYVLVTRIERPFSRLVPYFEFPQSIELWTAGGRLVRGIAKVPSGEAVPKLGVRTGPRECEWNPAEPATLTWVEALDGGDLRNAAAHRDRVFVLKAPFSGDPAEWLTLEHRFQGVSWTDRDVAFVTEFERATRTRRTWVLDGGQPRKVWQVSAEDRYRDPGRPLARPHTGEERGIVHQAGDWICLAGDGASPKGDRPFLDRFNVKTLDTERVYQSEGESYEPVVAVLSDDGRTVLTRPETAKTPPSYVVRDLAKQTRRVVTAFTDPAPILTGVERQFLTYTRKDGVRLSATLYLPPGYQKGTRVPMLMWAYPREFTDPGMAGQVSGSPYRFNTYAGASHMFLLTQGYAVLDNPTMPIVGPGETANDTYIEQLVASAEAAIDTVVGMGVADRGRVAVGGHSYGGFMTANLLAHSRLFKAGIARSGAYNRTLTPFGFQSEERTFWEVPDVYAKMSPFWYANTVKDPILLIHGEADNNSGTFPIQSERFYMALEGHGATVRYVTLPNEAHGYAARESVLHTLAEMVNWLDKYVKNAK